MADEKLEDSGLTQSEDGEEEEEDGRTGTRSQMCTTRVGPPGYPQKDRDERVLDSDRLKRFPSK